jgi:Tol biopolymer transport system component
MKHRRLSRAAGVAGAAMLVAALAGIASAKNFSDWGTPVNAEAIPGASSEINTTFNDGCPIESPDGRSLYYATNRPGGLGGQDIWVAERAHKSDPWGAPVHLPEPVNSSADDICPTPLDGKRLLFVSSRGGGFGNGDIYITRQKGDDWDEPENLGSNVNSAAGEAGPSLVKLKGRTLLFFSSTRPGGYTADLPDTDSDIYVSEELHHGGFGPATLVDGLNTAKDDARPNVRKDGLEVVFDSNRPGTLGGPDIWSSSREHRDDAWSPPVNLMSVNTASSETRGSLSGDGKRLTFGSNRPGAEGALDVYISTRDKLKGKDDEE